VARALRMTIALLLVCGTGLCSLPATAAARGGSLDFGDAPDGGPTGYLKGAGLGAFPSKLANGGPRHSRLPALRLGPRVDGEADSRQVNRDLYDDGAEAKLRSCSGSSRLTLGLNGRGLSAAQRSGANVIYVNAWFDWNRDGDWEDGSDGCAGEWAIRNLAVPASSLGSDGLRLLPIAFKAGKQTRELWWRVTISLNEPASDVGGRGPAAGYALGETEDYFQSAEGGPPPRFPDPSGKETKKEKEEREKEEREEKRRKKGKPDLTVSCNPTIAYIPHGGTARVGFTILAPGKGGPVYGAFASRRSAKSFKTGLIPARNQGGIPAGKVLATGFSFKSNDIDAPVRLQVFEVRFVFSREKTVRKVTCYVAVIHEGKARGHGKHQRPPKIPPVRCEGPCAEGTVPWANEPFIQTGSPPSEPPKEEEPSPIIIIGQARVTEIVGQQIGFQLKFDGAVDRFLLLFDGLQVADGTANAEMGGPLSCKKASFKGKTDGALECAGAVQPNEQVEGQLQVNSSPPADVNMQMHLYGFTGSDEYGPFPVDPPIP
jgi:GEVED domain